MLNQLMIGNCIIIYRKGGFGHLFLQENFETLDGEDANISDFADFAGGEQLDVAPTAVVVVTEGDAVVKLQDRAVRFPYRNVDGVATIQYMASGRDVD